MNERRPWWKLSWPAVVAGLMMLMVMSQRNLHVREFDMTALGPPTKFVDKLGWPLICVEKTKALDREPMGNPLSSDSIRIVPGSTRIASPMLFFVDIVCALTLVLGPVYTIDRWQHLGVLPFRITVKGLLAIMDSPGGTSHACTATITAGPAELGRHESRC